MAGKALSGGCAGAVQDAGGGADVHVEGDADGGVAGHAGDVGGLGHVIRNRSDTTAGHDPHAVQTAGQTSAIRKPGRQRKHQSPELMTIEGRSASQAGPTWNAITGTAPGLARHQRPAGTTISPIVYVRARLYGLAVIASGESVCLVLIRARSSRDRLSPRAWTAGSGRAAAACSWSSWPWSTPTM